MVLYNLLFLFAFFQDRTQIATLAVCYLSLCRMQIGYPNSEYQITKLLIEEQPKSTQQGHKQAFDHNQTCRPAVSYS
jgi:hypothetical protein